jgi:hypothetical protein
MGNVGSLTNPHVKGQLLLSDEPLSEWLISLYSKSPAVHPSGIAINFIHFEEPLEDLVSRGPKPECPGRSIAV